MSNLINQSDIKKVYLRWVLGCQLGWNYQTMQAIGYASAMSPVLKKIYPNKQELENSLEVHMRFFNTNPTTAHLVLGTNIAIEAEQKNKSLEAVAAIKTGLMGPLAGIGDTLFYVLPNTILLSIASYMALNGDYWGVFLWPIYNIIKLIIAYGFINKGYKEGTKLISSMGGVLRNITSAANILGITVIGAMIPTVIGTKTSLEFIRGDITVKLQEVLDSVMPGLIPIFLIAFVYVMLGKKYMTSTKMIFLLMLMGIILHMLGILA